MHRHHVWNIACVQYCMRVSTCAGTCAFLFPPGSCESARNPPVLAELVERRGRFAGDVGLLDRHGQRRPGEQLLVLGAAAAEGLPGGDGLQGH